MNTADSEEMAQPLKERGFTATENLQEADVAIMNTCTVREHAEHKALSNLGRLRTWKAANPDRLLIVAGCAASLWGESVKKKFPYIDLVSPATQIEKFPEIIEKVLEDRRSARQNSGNPEQRLAETAVKGSSISEHLSPTLWPAAVSDSRPSAQSPFIFGSGSTAYVTIMRGCNLSCSYCIVPQVRGREKYRAMPEILNEIRQKTSEGYREVMLLGQTVNSYYFRDGGSESRSIGETSPDRASPPTRRPADTVYDFADLLRAVDAIDGIETIRFMSPHPKHMRARTIAALRDCKKVARHVHLPLQSGSSAVLERMKRLYTREEYKSIIQQMREAMPGVSITTDVIVGYPGETPDEFQQTLSLLEEIRFNGLFAFKYSPRPGTDSALLADDVSESEKEERHQRILAMNNAIKEAHFAAGAA